MFVVLSLDSVKQDPAQMQELADRLWRILGVGFDGLLIEPKVRETHASWVTIHRGASGRKISHRSVLELVQEVVPEAVGVTEVHTFGGLPFDFAEGFTARFSPNYPALTGRR